MQMNVSSHTRQHRLTLAGLLALQIIAFASAASSAENNAPQGPPSVSPDGKWEFRLAAVSEGEESREVFVIAKRSTQEPSVTLSEEAMSFAEKAKIVWAPDSKRFAFNYQPGLRYSAVQFFQLDGDEWRELNSPGSDDAISAPIERSMAAQRKMLKLSPTKGGRPIAERL